MAKTAVGSVQNWIIWVLTSGSCAICTGRHPLPVMEEPGCDAFAPSDAHQGKQPLLARIPTFLPIPIFPITVSQNPLLYKKKTYCLIISNLGSTMTKHSCLIG